MPDPTAADMIRALKLKPHPEGGHYRETFRDSRQLNGRPASTTILFLLARGERSHWHRIDAVETWQRRATQTRDCRRIQGRNFQTWR